MKSRSPRHPKSIGPAGIAKSRSARKAASPRRRNLGIESNGRPSTPLLRSPLASSVVLSEGDVFCHPELDLSRREIRLLQIQSTEGNSSMIECELSTFEYGVHPLYDALSYTWGDPGTSNSILLNGRPFFVRDNLLSFLRTAWKQRRTGWIWIDAICINQHNILERNHQVRLMDKIYEGAEKVLAWLGVAADDSDFFLEKLRNERNYNIVEQAYLNLDEEGRSRIVSSVDAFFRRPYWRRIWVVQEIMLARDVLFVCGENAVSFEILQDWCSYAKVFKEKLSGHPASSLLLNGGSQFSRFHNRLRRVIELFINFEATDIRDRIYGLLSLVPPDLRIPVDYSKSIEQVFLDTMIKIGQKEDIELEEDGPSSFWKKIRRSWKLEEEWEHRDVALEACKKVSETTSGAEWSMRNMQITKVLNLQQSLNSQAQLLASTAFSEHTSRDINFGWISDDGDEDLLHTRTGLTEPGSNFFAWLG